MWEKLKEKFPHVSDEALEWLPYSIQVLKDMGAVVFVNELE